jgi:hypothetical protein
VGWACLALLGFCDYITPSSADFAMETEVCTSEVHAVPAPFSLAHQWVRIGKHCWVRQGIAGFKYEAG